MKNLVMQSGDNITVPAPYAVASGAGVLVGAMFGVASSDAALNANVVIVRKGVYTLAKATGQAWTAGARLYWDNTAKNVTTTASGNTLIGFAQVAAASGATTGNVILTGQA